MVVTNEIETQAVRAAQALVERSKQGLTILPQLALLADAYKVQRKVELKLFVGRDKEKVKDLKNTLGGEWKVITPGQALYGIRFDQIVLEDNEYNENELKWINTTVLSRLAPAKKTSRIYQVLCYHNDGYLRPWPADQVKVNAVRS